MGLDNVGHDKIPVSAELNSSESSGDDGFKLETDWKNKGDTKNDINTIRLNSYNTLNSRLWNFIAQYYKQEIFNLYTTLRKSGIYSEDTICNFIENLTSKIISES
jgi:hypothetical protein